MLLILQIKQTVEIIPKEYGPVPHKKGIYSLFYRTLRNIVVSLGI